MSGPDAFEALVGTTFRVVGAWEAAAPAPVDADAVPEAAPGIDEPAPDAPEPEAAESAPPDEVEAVEDEPVAPIEITLTAVERLDFPGPYEQFSVSFAGPSSTPLEQGTFVLEPEPAGFGGLFLVPSADDGDQRRYVASLSVPRSSTGSVEP